MEFWLYNVLGLDPDSDGLFLSLFYRFLFATIEIQRIARRCRVDKDGRPNQLKKDKNVKQRYGLTLLSLLIFLFPTAVNALTPTVLHSFAGTTDGANPRQGLTLGVDGLLYGGSQSGGANNAGVLFRSTSAGAVTTLHSMTSTTDGNAPFGIFVADPFSSYYGTTQTGGAGGAGTVFKMSTLGVG